MTKYSAGSYDVCVIGAGVMNIHFPHELRKGAGGYKCQKNAQSNAGPLAQSMQPGGERTGFRMRNSPSFLLCQPIEMGKIDRMTFTNQGFVILPFHASERNTFFANGIEEALQVQTAQGKPMITKG